MARPSEYNPRTASAICERVACGQTIREICSADDMPAMSTVFKWLNKNPEFAEQYARAKEAQADFLAEEMLEIADDGTNDWMERQGGASPGWMVNGEAVQRSRLRVDARKWLMAKMAPKKYGDRITQEHTGPGGTDLFTAHLEALHAAGRPKPKD